MSQQIGFDALDPNSFFSLSFHVLFPCSRSYFLPSIILHFGPLHRPFFLFFFFDFFYSMTTQLLCRFPFLVLSIPFFSFFSFFFLLSGQRHLFQRCIHDS